MSSVAREQGRKNGKMMLRCSSERREREKKNRRGEIERSREKERKRKEGQLMRKKERVKS